MLQQFKTRWDFLKKNYAISLARVLGWCRAGFFSYISTDVAESSKYHSGKYCTCSLMASINMTLPVAWRDQHLVLKAPVYHIYIYIYGLYMAERTICYSGHDVNLILNLSDSWLPTEVAVGASGLLASFQVMRVTEQGLLGPFNGIINQIICLSVY